MRRISNWRSEMKKLSLVIFVFLFGLFSVQCGKRAILRKYYLLYAGELDKQELPVESANLPFSVDIRDFRVSRAYNQTRIALRSQSHELNYYYYHHWAVRPSAAIADLVYSVIQKSGTFRRCSRSYTYNPDYYITGQINQIERLQKGNKAFAHITADFILTDYRSELPAFKHHLERTVELQNDKSMNLFAQTISEIIRSETEIFIEKIAELLRDKGQEK
jgi:ABC-type uncharacterized transport system auxiliary subunit